MQVLRTPDERFASLPDFPFAAHYAQIPAGGAEGTELRMAYLDEAGHGGPGHTIVLMHGEPSWSFLYRKMIPVLTEAGHRCIAPDLIGFGRSDKPTELGDYTFAHHVEWVRQLLFDHRIYKSYPLSLIENRDLPKLTSWLNRLTTLPLEKMDLTGLTTWQPEDDCVWGLREIADLARHLPYIPRP